MEEPSNKTIICSVFFLDIIEYSKKSVSAQISLKERFNAFLSIAIRDVPVGDRIILDTGDGAAISFLGDISDALHAALSMRSSLLNEGLRMEPPLQVRMGINLGPVRLVKDINGQPNIVGDGINVAQRVMGFADSVQILVSRSYFDAVSRLSQDYAGMFHYQGSRTDKHVREHEVYAIGYPGDFTSTQRSLSKKSRQAEATGVGTVWVALENRWDAFSGTMARWERRIIDAYIEASAKQRTVFIGAAAIVLVSLVTLIFHFARHSESNIPAGALAVNDVKVKAPLNILAQDARGNTVKPVAEAKASAPAPVVQPKKGGPTSGRQKEVATGKKEKIIKKNSRVRTLAETTGAPAVVSLVIRPWGEIYLDGRIQGISPPLMELQVVAGRHEIKIRNTTFPEATRIIQVEPGEKTKIKHKFAN